MRKRSKSGMLFLIALVIVVSGCVQQGEQERTEKLPSTGEAGVPVYSGSEVYTAPTFFYQMMGIPMEGVSVHVYYVEKGSVNDVLNWYKEKMKDYTLIEEIPLVTLSTPHGNVEWGAVLFQKGDQAIGIWAMSGHDVEGGKGVVYYVVSGPIDKLKGEITEAKEKEKLPSKDQASGEEPIERYPNSVMLEYRKQEGYPAPGTSLIITYGTPDSIDEVTNWYKDFLLERGWSLGEVSKSGESAHIGFSKNGEQIYIIVNAPTEYRDYTTIEVWYTPNKLPSTDIASGEEPVSRYPGSVMLDHFSMVMGKGKTISITYGSYDDPEAILNWYISELQNSGWEITMQTSSGGTLALSAFKEGVGSLTVEIKKDAYTEISVMYNGVI